MFNVDKMMGGNRGFRLFIGIKFQSNPKNYISMRSFRLSLPTIVDIREQRNFTVGGLEGTQSPGLKDIVLMNSLYHWDV